MNIVLNIIKEQTFMRLKKVTKKKILEGLFLKSL